MTTRQEPSWRTLQRAGADFSPRICADRNVGAAASKGHNTSEQARYADKSVGVAGKSACATSGVHQFGQAPVPMETGRSACAT
jgi:hypothetical protein